MLHLYRRLIGLRHRAPALARGSFDLIDLPEGVLGYRRSLGDRAWVVLVNFTDQAVDVGGSGAVPEGLSVELSSDGLHQGDGFDGQVGADQALVLG